MLAPVVVRHLQEIHPAPEWATFQEFADGTGGAKARTIDLLAFNLWPSKGYQTVAYEVKVSRADFRRELDDPSKRAPWELLAHETWFAAPTGVISKAEVPEGWGLLEVSDDGKTKRTVRAMQRLRGTPPIAFTASMARRTTDPAPAPLLGWELMGKKVGLDDLVRLAGALSKHRWQRMVSATSPREEWELAHQTRIVEDRRRLGLLSDAVFKLCGPQAATAEGFRAWFRGANRGPAVDAFQRRQLESARRVITELLGEPTPPPEIR